MQLSAQLMQQTAAIDKKVGCNTVEYTTASLHSDWLYFLWHGIRDTTCNTITLRSIIAKTVSETSKSAIP